MSNRKLKWEFIKSYLIKNGGHVDIMCRDFVEKYIEEFKPPYKATNYGADKCPQLGRILKEMYDMRLLDRKRVGITCGYSGYPKWVYCYELKTDRHCI